jgi:hypothetical protein
MASDKTQQRNREEVQALAQRNEYQKSIALSVDADRKADSFIRRLLIKIRQRRQHQGTELSLFRDQFEFETGLDSRGNGKEKFKRACQVHLSRAAAKKEAREEKALFGGPLSEGWDEEMNGTMGEDPDFVAMSIEQNPDLKRYKR